MARSRRTRRDTSAIANRRLPRSQTPSVSPRRMQSDFLRSVSDGRFFNPEPSYVSQRSLSGLRHRLKLYEPRARRIVSSRHESSVQMRSVQSSVPTAIGFTAPKSMLVCVRRQQRREVMHALNKSGRGGQKRPRFNEFSKVRCK